MTTYWPRHIYREDELRWAWWLHIILVVVWGMECGRRWLGGILAQSSRVAKIGSVRRPQMQLVSFDRGDRGWFKNEGDFPK